MNDDSSIYIHLNGASATFIGPKAADYAASYLAMLNNIERIADNLNQEIPLLGKEQAV